MTWASAVTDPLRVVDYRAEAVSVSGQSLGDVPVDGVRIDYDGDRTGGMVGSVRAVGPVA